MKALSSKLLCVYQKLPTRFNTYYFRLEYYKDGESSHSHITIHIDSSRFYEELLNLKEKKVDRIYFAYETKDIDFFIHNNAYIIEYRPSEGVELYFKLIPDEFEKLLNAVKKR